MTNVEPDILGTAGNEEVCARKRPPLRPGLKLPEAMARVSHAIHTEPDYAWGWHCNLAMAAYDEGVDHRTANKVADRFMKLLFDVDSSDYGPETW